MLDAALARTPGLDHVRFSRRTALFGRYDVVHFHWPETMLGGVSAWKRVVRRAFATAVVLRLRLGSAVVVRTVHNVDLPQDVTRWERWILHTVERLCAFRIVLNEQTEAAGPQAVILHGHYRDWFADVPRVDGDTAVLGFVGLVRRYKGVETLIAAFRAAAHTLPEATLRIAGRASTAELMEDITSLTAGDERIELDLRYLSEAEFAQAVMAVGGIVLPYRFMHNSGTALAVLSLDRPVLVPDNEVNRALSAEVGPGWVHRYTGDITAGDLERFARAIADRPRSAPDLHRREWDRVGTEHREAFERAVTSVRHGSSA